MRIAGYQRNIKASFIPGQIKSLFLLNEWREEVVIQKKLSPTVISYTYRIRNNNPGPKIVANPNPKPNLKPDYNPNTIPLPLTKKRPGQFSLEQISDAY